LQYLRRLAGLRPDLSPAFLDIGQRYADWRYAGLELADEEKTQLARRLKRFRLAAATNR
jgi:hypothetical protein